MHSPGGIPGVSPAVTWNATAAERQWSAQSSSLRGLDYLALGILSVASLNPAIRVARPVGGFLGRQLVLKPLFKVQRGFTNPITAGQTVRSWHKWGERAEVVVGIADIVEGSSSRDLVQNGGPSATPLYISKRAVQRKLESRKDSTTHSAHGFRSGKAPTRRKRCPPGHRWNGRRCVPIRKR